jgi:hypothetical protein
VELGNGSEPVSAQPRAGSDSVSGRWLHARPIVRQVAKHRRHTTYRLELVLAASALNCYRIFGSEASPMQLSGRIFQAPNVPSVGGVPMRSTALVQSAAWHSFLTVGVMNQGSELTATGIDFTQRGVFPL